MSFDERLEALRTYHYETLEQEKRTSDRLMARIEEMETAWERKEAYFKQLLEAAEQQQTKSLSKIASLAEKCTLISIKAKEYK